MTIEQIETGQNILLGPAIWFWWTESRSLFFYEHAISSRNIVPVKMKMNTRWYFEDFMNWGVFGKVKVAFLGVGHIHDDRKQGFSKSLSCIRWGDNMKMKELSWQLYYTWIEHRAVALMEHLIDCSGLCITETCIFNVYWFFNYWYYGINAAIWQIHSCFPRVSCFVLFITRHDSKTLKE